MTNATITKSVFFNAPREIVWEFLTDKDKMGQWFFFAEADLAMGSDYELFDKQDDGSHTKRCWGKVLEMEKPAKLVYSFTIDMLGGNMTTISWDLQEVEGGTKLSLSHSNIDKAAGEAAMALLTALDAGWDRHFGKMRDAIS